ncbi:RNA polymerase II-associated protein 3-like, partial [Gigantopelta aegis]|uniref:RNA polymerase II-associated protein 3-like n=1 Tax=Gigantopelta aegis TaxID=1735272 RepID=UPI001B88E1D7
MAVSKHEDRMITLQQQVKENQLEIQEYLADLDSWTSDVTAKDRALVKHKVTEEPKLPPVRNSLNKKKRKKVKKKLVENGQGSEKTTRRISGYDYRAWDTFDI